MLDPLWNPGNYSFLWNEPLEPSVRLKISWGLGKKRCQGCFLTVGPPTKIIGAFRGGQHISEMSSKAIWFPLLQMNQVEKVQRTAARCTSRGWRNTRSVGEMLDGFEWPSLEARRDRSSLLLSHQIHSKRQLPDPCPQFENYQVTTQCQIFSIPDIQWCLEELFLSPKYSKVEWFSPTVVNSQTTEEFRALLI